MAMQKEWQNIVGHINYSNEEWMGSAEGKNKNTRALREP